METLTHDQFLLTLPLTTFDVLPTAVSMTVGELLRLKRRYVDALAYYGPTDGHDDLSIEDTLDLGDLNYVLLNIEQVLYIKRTVNTAIRRAMRCLFF